MNARSDVVIIGAGVSAAVAALALAEAGVSVTCLEQGGWPDRASFRGGSAASELAGMKQWSSLPGIRQNAGDYPLDEVASDMRALNFNGVGGGSLLYNGQWPRLLPSDFRVRSHDGVGADWPLSYAELQPFYEETDRQFGVSGLGGNPVYPDGEEPPLPALPIGPAGLAVARVHARRGWHWWPENNAILSVAYRGRRPCAQRGTCSHGCDEGAKASTDLTHWPAFEALGGVLKTGATVRRILVDASDRATGVEWVDANGQEQVHNADVVLCAANGIGTPRLLLASADARRPDGLANDSGLLGWGLMLHPMTLVEGVNPNGAPWHGHNGGLINSLEFYRSDASRGFVRGARWALTAGGLPLATALGGRCGWGPGHHQLMRDHVGRRVMWVVLAEDLPEDTNRVTLTAKFDAQGMAVAAINYRIGDNTRRLLEWHAARAHESLTAAGIVDLTVSQAGANGHFMGTARMGDDPAASVCDRWGFTHQIRNLAIIDGSVFPTCGAMNPTTTIAALALRTARHLLEQRSIPPATRRHVKTPSVRASPVTMRLESPAQVTPEERERLTRIADVLLPGGAGLPSAGEAGVAGALLDEVLTVRPDVLPELRRVLDSLGTGPYSIEGLQDSGGAQFRTLAMVVAGAYYLSPEVRESLGWHSEKGAVLGPPGFPSYVQEGLLDHLLG